MSDSNTWGDIPCPVGTSRNAGILVSMETPWLPFLVSKQELLPEGSKTQWKNVWVPGQAGWMAGQAVLLSQKVEGLQTPEGHQEEFVGIFWMRESGPPTWTLREKGSGPPAEWQSRE